MSLLCREYLIYMLLYNVLHIKHYNNIIIIIYYYNYIIHYYILHITIINIQNVEYLIIVFT